jgi:beta-lactamase class A
MNRRDAVKVMTASLAANLWLEAQSQGAGALARLAEIEKRTGGRLGIAVLDLENNRRLQHRSDERFPMCSTFKFLLVAQVLSRVDSSKEQLSRIISYGQADLLEYAPIAKEHVNEGGMTVAALCDAAIRYSDNTAANLLLNTVGGPSGLTAWIRSIGDPVTRLDRNEPDLNSAVPGDPRDTTTPSAMLRNLHYVLIEMPLANASGVGLTAWLMGNTTGNEKLRAGLPPGWKVGDKTGTGANGSTNDIAIVWPANRKPLLIAVYLTGTNADLSARNAALADTARLIADWIGKT